MIDNWINFITTPPAEIVVFQTEEKAISTSTFRVVDVHVDTEE